jgi:serine/threonine-protein kinase RsbW
LSSRIGVKIETRVEELNRIASVVEEMGEKEGWPPDLVFKVNLILEELSLNIINYGHTGGLHEIDITLTSTEDALKIDIVDDGMPFDPISDAPTPDVNAPMEDRGIGGLGVHLVQAMTDEMHYRRVRDTNQVTLVIRRA